MEDNSDLKSRYTNISQNLMSLVSSTKHSAYEKANIENGDNMIKGWILSLSNIFESGENFSRHCLAT